MNTMFTLLKRNGDFFLSGFDIIKASTIIWSSSDFTDKEVPDYLKTWSYIPEVKEFIDKVENEKLKKNMNKKYSQLNSILEGATKDIGVDYGIKYPDGNDRSLLILTLYNDPKETWYVYRGDKGLQKYVRDNSKKILNEVNLAPYLPTNEILVETLKKLNRKTSSFKGKLVRDLIVQGDWPAFVDKELTQIFDYMTTVENVKYYFVSSK